VRQRVAHVPREAVDAVVLAAVRLVGDDVCGRSDAQSHAIAQFIRPRTSTTSAIA
jgi:hypothetical protein